MSIKSRLFGGIAQKLSVDQAPALRRVAAFMDAEWNEGDHPRDKGGQFTSGGGSSGGGESKPPSEKAPAAISPGSERQAPTFSSPPPKEFRSKLIAAKESIRPEDRWRVDIHPEEDYNHDKLYATPGGSCIAVEPRGNIVSVCKNAGSTDRGSDLLKKAVENGGDRLDAFGPTLHQFYTKNGFEPVSWCEFDEQYAPEGWVKGRDNPEPVIFYKYTGKRTQEGYHDFLGRVRASDGYDSAYAMRDQDMEARK